MRASMLVIGLTAACRYNFDAVGDASIDTPVAPEPLTIRVVGDGAVIGTDIACDGTCTVPRTGELALTPFAGQGWRLASLANASCRTTGACTVAAEVLEVTATFEREPYTTNIVFVSSVPAPLTSGLPAIDSFCQARADAAGLPGTYVGLLTTTGADLQTRVTGSRGWVRTDGLPVFDLPTFGVATARAVVLDENATPGLGFVMTGSNGTGSPIGTRCSDWTANTAQGDGGRTEFTGQFSITGQVATVCAGRVYCFGVGLNVPVTVGVAFPMGRYIFTSSTPFVITTGGGIAAADARCQSDAAAANLPGTYRALLATTTESAAMRIGSLAGRWRRPDGVVVSRNGLVPPFDATVNVDATGAPVVTGNFTILGAPSMTSTGTNTCGDWTDTSMNYHYGSISSVTLHNINSCCAACATGQLVCAQL